MSLAFDTETIRLMNLFENLSGTVVKDCILDENSNSVFFIVNKNQAKIAIGRNGIKIKNIEKILKRKIKVFEYSEDVKKFVKNIVPNALSVDVVENSGKKIVIIRVDRNDRPIVIGRDGRNLKILKKILNRNHDISEVIIR